MADPHAANREAATADGINNSKSHTCFWLFCFFQNVFFGYNFFLKDLNKNVVEITESVHDRMSNSIIHVPQTVIFPLAHKLWLLFMLTIHSS